MGDYRKRVVVIGAGAAGLMAGITAAQSGAFVRVIEKNPGPGRKLALTGNGRCNLTHMTDTPGIIKGLPGNGRFLYKALQRFGPVELMAFMESLGVPTKVEADDRVFPVSDRARDVIAALRGALERQGGEGLWGRTVQRIAIEDGRVSGVFVENGERIKADAVIVATGGASYPGTGSTGDGYRLAEATGHSVTPIRPSLVPLVSSDSFVPALQGVTLQDIRIRGLKEGKCLAEERGDMIFTHFGCSGPAILRLSRMVVPALAEGAPVELAFNLAGTDETTWDARVRQVMDEGSRKATKNLLEQLLPHKMVNVFLDWCGIAPEKPVHQITREERRKIVRLMTDLRMRVTGHRPLAEATVTAGGVSTKELNPQTMESKLITGLYFAGEVVDVDGYTGGYNLQAAFSMGYVAGEAAGAQVRG
jgi:predicted Rossmann fold flavoprotein